MYRERIYLFLKASQSKSCYAHLLREVIGRSRACKKVSRTQISSGMSGPTGKQEKQLNAQNTRNTFSNRRIDRHRGFRS
jgi:hypothetical protein